MLALILFVDKMSPDRLLFMYSVHYVRSYVTVVACGLFNKILVASFESDQIVARSSVLHLIYKMPLVCSSALLAQYHRILL